MNKSRIYAYEHELSEFEKKILQICSLYFEPITKTNLLKLLRKSKVKFPPGKFTAVSSLNPYLNKLQKKLLLDNDLMCRKSLQEDIAREAVQEEDFYLLEKEIRTICPAEHIFMLWGNPQVSSCRRLIRDIRLAMLSADKDSFHQRMDLLEAECQDDEEYDELLINTIMYPFDKLWFQSLPLEIQTRTLSYIIARQYSWYIYSFQEVKDYALEIDLSNGEMSADEEERFFYVLGKYLLKSGLLKEAEEAISIIIDTVQKQKLQAWLFFLQEKPEQAAQYFDQALKALRREKKYNKAFFKDECGLIYILCLLRLQDKISLKTAHNLIKQALSKANFDSNFAPGYVALKGVLHSLNLELDKARSALFEAREMNRYLNDFMDFLFGLASFWIEGKASKDYQEKLENIFNMFQGIGLNWLAYEAGALLDRISSKKLGSKELSKVKKLGRQLQIDPLVNIITPMEPWRKTLYALQNLADPKTGKEEGQPEQRVIWLVTIYGEMGLDLQPKLQKTNKKGEWTKGRNIALNKLFHESDKMDFLTEEDKRILEALKHYYSPYSGSSYEFDQKKALPLLAGHPRIFSASDPDQPLEFVLGEPEISVSETKKGYVLKMTPEIGFTSTRLIKETPNRYRVVHFKEEHRRISNILSSRSFTVPKSGYDDLVRAVSSLSGLVTIHSDLKDHTTDVQEVQADPMPCLQIFPSGPNFRVELTVRPFNSSGPVLKPGLGQGTLISEVQGKRMLAKRDLELEKAKAQEVQNLCPSLNNWETEQGNMDWILPDIEDCLQLLTELKGLQEQDKVRVYWPEGEQLRLAGSASMDKLRISLRTVEDWFELSGRIELNQDLVLQLKDLLASVQNSSTRFLPLNESSYVALTERLRRRLRQLAQLSETKGSKIRMPAHSLMALEELSDEVGELQGDKSWTEQKQAIEEAFAQKPEPPSTLRAELRDYQIEGYQWLSRLAKLGFGACLADDMGLGKTLQALALILKRATQGPSLVVAPTSVCANWFSETHRFAPTLNPIIYAGKDRERLLEELGPFSLIICSYALLLQDAQELSRIYWESIVLDEAQAIKNWTAKRTQAAMDLKAGFKMVTTGTPIENNLNELWTLFRFLNPGLLGPRKRFHERFTIPVQKYEDQEQKKLLKKILRPFILRRLKSQVMEELPPRTEVTLKVRLSDEEATLYEAMRRQALEDLEKEEQDPGQKHFKILAALTKLRQTCCHPELVFPESSLPSSKLNLLEEIVQELLDNGHKALIFSQFVKYLDLVRKRLDQMGIDYRYLDGSTPNHLREKEINAFQSGHGELFLISLKAGGQGLNLTAADYVIHLDPWWNPAVEDQATDRTHRIGQERPVNVYRLITENTVEEKIIKLHSEKRELADTLLEGSDVSKQISAQELMQLLREDETSEILPFN